MITDHIYANSKGEAKAKALKMARSAAFISTNNEEAAMATKVATITSPSGKIVSKVQTSLVNGKIEMKDIS